MPDTVKISVDGRELQTRSGTLLIEACRAAGIEVPSFCYYPGLSLQAACRMCLVEIEKAPKLQTACTVQVSPGVYFDAPRCILCYRCVRVCDEGMGVSALSVVNRGARSEIAPNHGDHLDCEECGMCIDICPVGALTSGACRYQTRPWEIQYVSTICTHCGDGCKTTLSVRNNKIVRGNNRDHSGVNGEFLCIKGRYAYDFIDHAERVRRPLIRRGEQEPWTEA